MCVKVGNSISRCYPCSSGVPQGGVLSPLLFLIYTYDLPRRLKTHPAVKVQIYADDIKIYGAYNDHNQEEVCQALSQSISIMMEWAAAWHLPVNISKSCVLHFGKDNKSEYSYHDLTFRSVTEVCDLGISLDSRLDFKSHIEAIVKKSSLYALLYS